MADLADLPGGAGKPDPTQVDTPAEFVEAMRRLKRWTGWGYRRLEKRAAMAGQALPRSTLTVALTRNTLPRDDLVAAFARACGCDEDETARWVAARRRIAAAPDPAKPTPPPAPDAATHAKAGARAGRRTVLVGLMPPFIRRARWPVRVIAALVVLAATVALVGYLVRPVGPSHPGQTPGLAAPAQADQDRPTPAPPVSTSSTSASPASTTAGPTPTAGTPPGTRTGPPVPPTGMPPPEDLPAPTGTPRPTTAPTPPAPTPLPRCTDNTYRHVGDQRVQLPAYGSSSDCVLSYGARGEGVKALQVALINCNGAGGVNLTEIYDQKTYDAILWIQAGSGASPADGIYRPQTRQTLIWVHDNGTAGTCARYDET